MYSKKIDQIVESNVELLRSRSAIGIEKYGTTLADSNLPMRDRLNHALLEALDQANYLQWAIQACDQSDVAPADCSGTPASCPDNEGYGCACSPATAPQVVADETMRQKNEQFAAKEWLDKTEWVQQNIDSFPLQSLGKHRADVMREEIERLRAAIAAAPVQAQEPVAALMYMDELPAAQAGEKWIQQFASEADKVLYAPDEASHAVRVKWCAYFDSYDRLVAAFLLTRDAKNWTQLTKVRGEAFSAPVQPVAVPDVDYPKLLAKYIEHVGAEEGCDFLGRLWLKDGVYVGYGDKAIFSPKEYEALDFAKDFDCAMAAAPAAQGDAKDAERYRFLSENIQEGYELPGGFYLADHDTSTWDGTIDAAIAAKAAS